MSYQNKNKIIFASLLIFVFFILKSLIHSNIENKTASKNNDIIEKYFRNEIKSNDEKKSLVIFLKSPEGKKCVSEVELKIQDMSDGIDKEGAIRKLELLKKLGEFNQ